MLLDLQNAFGEVSHNLIESVLRYYHIPKEVILIVRNLYEDFHTVILTTLIKSLQILFIKEYLLIYYS